MKLIAICATAFSIVFTYCSSQCIREQMRQETKLRVQMFRDYARIHAKDPAGSQIRPSVEIVPPEKL